MAEVVIPSNPLRSLKRGFDRTLYTERNRIERCFGRLKHCRWIATRYEKSGRNSLTVVQLVSTLTLLR